MASVSGVISAINKLSKPLQKKPSNITDWNLTVGDVPVEHPVVRTWNMTPPAQAMPNEYKNDDPIKAYRDYCTHEKHYAKWEKGRSPPEWWVN